MIHILCPAHLASGGPELLHQLGYKLNLLGFDANIFYYNPREGVDPVCEQYRKYGVPYTDAFDPSLDTMLVIPEPMIPWVPKLEGFQRVVWWLSVDNANYENDELEYMRTHTDVLHLVQSQYAFDFLQENGIDKERIFYLSDYINSEFLLSAQNLKEECSRENVVLFNPRKGISKTLDLISKSTWRIRWQALSGLTPYGMREVMKRAKVYIDFGHHPGKDRIPREAALCGCCVLTNKKGSAGNAIDVPIPERYKFDESSSDSQILDCIYQLLEQYETKKDDYTAYVEKIKKEFVEFEKDIVRFFGAFLKKHETNPESAEQCVEDILRQIESGNYDKALQRLVDYRICGYEENLTVNILETVIRIGLGEYPEAEICALRGLEKEPENYELYLNLAHISFLTNRRRECLEYCEKAIRYSHGTPDEEYVKNVCEKEFGVIVQDMD